MKLSEHFDVSEFVPAGTKTVPGDILGNMVVLAVAILEPLREHFGVPVHIHDCWRPAAKNAAVGGVQNSDHLTGSAVDFHVAETPYATWEENTIEAFDWIRENLPFGQLILEDHRMHTGEPGKLWVHVALKTARHPGNTGDRNRILVSHEPKHYEQWRETREA